VARVFIEENGACYGKKPVERHCYFDETKLHEQTKRFHSQRQGFMGRDQG